jgi:hypothetical protein
MTRYVLGTTLLHQARLLLNSLIKLNCRLKPLPSHRDLLTARSIGQQDTLKPNHCSSGKAAVHSVCVFVRVCVCVDLYVKATI